MTTNNVVMLRREKRDLREDVINKINEDDQDLQFYISFPEDMDEGKIFFYTNFDPGVPEIYALETLIEYFKDQVFSVVEE